MADLNEQMRAEFEAWAKESGYPLDKCEEGSRIGPVGSYKHTTTIHAWEVWQAARRQHGSAAQAVYFTRLPSNEFHSFVREAWVESDKAAWDSADSTRRRILYTAPPVADAARIETWQERVPEGAYAYEIEDAKDAEIAELRAALSRRPAAAAEPEKCDPRCKCLPEARCYSVAAEQPAAELGLLPLPEPRAIRAGDSFPKVYALAYTADQMHAYARAHLRAAGQGSEQESMTFSEMQELIRAAQREMAEIRAGQGKDSERLDEFAKHPNWELSADYDEDDLTWRVHKVVGSRNDREWIEVGRGTTPRIAIDAAMKAGAQGGK